MSPSREVIDREQCKSPSIFQATEASLPPVLGALQTERTVLSKDYNFWLHIIIQPGPRWSLFAQEECPVGYTVTYEFDGRRQRWVQKPAVRGDQFATTRSIKVAVPVAKLDEVDDRILALEDREQTLLATFLDTMEQVRLTVEQDQQLEDIDPSVLVHKALLELAEGDVITTANGTFEKRIEILMDFVCQEVGDVFNWSAAKGFEWVPESEVKRCLGLA
ncbi:hypothetical protein AX16_007784 [Volvariella volvacea WC 439]|nr:hypothetical protein AX16_007784 [Volvariella volvacea WC 439]